MIRLQEYCIAVLVLLVFPWPASATPPDILTADIVMLAGSPGKAVFFVNTGFNHGSHHLWETRWLLLAMDITDNSFQWESLGSMIVATEEYGGTGFSRTEGALTIPEALETWGVERSLRFKGDSYFAASNMILDYFIRDSLLYARCGDEVFAFHGARCFDPGDLAVLGTESEEYYIAEGTPVVREVDQLYELLRFFSYEDDTIGLILQAEVEFEDVYLLIATVMDEVAPFDVIFTIPVLEMNEARAYLFEIGFDP